MRTRPSNPVLRDGALHVHAWGPYWINKIRQRCFPNTKGIPFDLIVTPNKSNDRKVNDEFDVAVMNKVNNGLLLEPSGVTRFSEPMLEPRNIPHLFGLRIDQPIRKIVDGSWATDTVSISGCTYGMGVEMVFREMGVPFVVHLVDAWDKPEWFTDGNYVDKATTPPHLSLI